MIAKWESIGYTKSVPFEGTAIVRTSLGLTFFGYTGLDPFEGTASYLAASTGGSVPLLQCTRSV